jgi:RNA recognition motif-containing protein
VCGREIAFASHAIARNGSSDLQHNHCRKKQVTFMGQRLFVGNLSFNTTAETIRAEFSAHDEVTDVHLVTDRETGRARGFAFVTMGSPQGAQKAIEALNGAVVDGRPLKVNEAEERPNRGGGGGGGFGGGGGGGRRGGGGHRGW